MSMCRGELCNRLKRGKSLRRPLSTLPGYVAFDSPPREGGARETRSSLADSKRPGTTQGHTVPVKIRLRHVVHSLVVLAVLTQLTFAGLYLADLIRTSDTYDGLVAHRVAVTAQRVGCFTAPGEFYDNCY